MNGMHLQSLSRRRLLVGGATAGALAAGIARAQTPVAANIPVWRYELIDARLPNGLQIVLLPSRRAPIVTHMVWYRVGSADEPAGQSGLAHFLEHLMFKGTGSVPAGELSRRVARTGGRDNAFTSFDYTGYFQTVAPEHLEMVMGMEADRMANLQILESELLPERDVVIEERRQVIESRPAALLDEVAAEAMWGRQGYGRPISGWPDEVRRLGVAEAMAFYRLHYTPNNAALIVAGDFDAPLVLAMAERYYGPHARRDVPPRTRPQAPAPDLPRRVERRDPRVRQAEFNLDYVAPSYHVGETRHAYALQLLAQVLGGGQVSRLWQVLVSDRKVALSLSVGYGAQAVGLTSFRFWASAAPGRTLGEIEAVLDAEIARVLRDGIGEDELARARTRLLAATVYAQDSLSTGPRLYGAALTTGGSVEDVNAWPARIAAVTTAQVIDAARAVLRREQSVVSLLLPQEAGK
jgi:zinc protease